MKQENKLTLLHIGSWIVFAYSILGVISSTIALVAGKAVFSSMKHATSLYNTLEPGGTPSQPTAPIFDTSSIIFTLILLLVVIGYGLLVYFAYRFTGATYDSFLGNKTWFLSLSIVFLALGGLVNFVVLFSAFMKDWAENS